MARPADQTSDVELLVALPHDVTACEAFSTAYSLGSPPPPPSLPGR